LSLTTNRRPSLSCFVACLIGVSSLFSASTFAKDPPDPGTPKPAEPAPLWTPPTQAEWTTAGKKDRSDIVNMYLHGSASDVIAAAMNAGWVSAAKDTPVNDALYAVVGLWRSVLKGLHFSHRGKCPKPYKLDRFMPASTETYHDDHQDPQGEKQEFIFQQGDDHPWGRHHFRVYSTGKVDEKGLPVWAVSATEDIGFNFDVKKPTQFFFTHTVDHNADDERDFVYQSLLNTDSVVSKREIPVDVGPPNPANGLTSASGKVFDITLTDVNDDEKNEKEQ
jgi:hypothetical protein